MNLTAVYLEDPAGGYVAFVEELPGANTQGDTLEEARENLREAITLIIGSNRESVERDIKGQKVIRERIDVSAA